MADKIINLRIDVTKLNKAHFFKGEKGTYADCVLFYNEEQDQFGANGMIVQSVSKEVYEKEKNLPKDQKTKGAILGNAKVWGNSSNVREGVPGSEQAKATPAGSTPIADDLPF